MLSTASSTKGCTVLLVHDGYTMVSLGFNIKRIAYHIVAIALFVSLIIVSKAVYAHYYGQEPVIETIATTTKVTEPAVVTFAYPPSTSDPSVPFTATSSTKRIVKPTVEEPKEEINQDSSGIPSAAELVEVVWVSDGDTYIVDYHGTETTIRLIGVDTPESVASDEYLEKSGKQNTVEGKIASKKMKELLPAGSHIYILLGEDPLDQYGRTLAYAWFSDGTMIEDFLLSNGYAKLLTIEPNTQYADHFQSVFDAAEIEEAA